MVSNLSNEWRQTVTEVFLDEMGFVTFPYNDLHAVFDVAQNYIKQIGAHVPVSGDLKQKTPEKMQEYIEAATKIAHLNAARSILVDLETEGENSVYTEDSIYYLRSRIFEHLIEAEAGVEALDETGKSTAAAIDRRIDSAVKHASLIYARHVFDALENHVHVELEDIDEDGYGGLRYWVNTINQILAEAGEDLSALDSTGQSTVKDIEQRIEEAKTNAYIRTAQYKFDFLESVPIGQLIVLDCYTSDDIQRIGDDIATLLNKAGQDADALDRTHQSSKQDMEERLSRAVSEAMTFAQGQKYMSDGPNITM
jgi:hypothetical protein